jgi:E3 ubiquitin-protein ligase UHRF1
MADLPCDGDGVCMVCKTVPPDSDVLLCNGCVSPWHMQCLNPPLTAPPAGDWFCPDCSLSTTDNQSEPVVVNKSSGAPGDDLISQIRAIQADPKLSEDEKARKRQELMASGSSKQQESSGDVKGSNREAKRNKVLEMFDESLNCTFCMQLPERPVTVSDCLAYAVFVSELV